MSRKASFTVRIERDGYLTKTVAVRHRTSGGGVSGALGSAILPIPYVGSLATLFDIRSGATQSLSPNPLRVTLEPEPRVSAAEPGATPPAGRF